MAANSLTSFSPSRFLADADAFLTGGMEQAYRNVGCVALQTGVTGLASFAMETWADTLRPAGIPLDLGLGAVITLGGLAASLSEDSDSKISQSADYILSVGSGLLGNFAARQGRNIAHDRLNTVARQKMGNPSMPFGEYTTAPIPGQK